MIAHQAESIRLALFQFPHVAGVFEMVDYDIIIKKDRPGIFVLFFLLPSLHAPVFSLHDAEPWSLGSVPPHQLLSSYFESFGIILFLPHAAIGAVVFVAVLFHSRLMILHATVGMAVGMAPAGTSGGVTSPYIRPNPSESCAESEVPHLR